ATVGDRFVVKRASGLALVRSEGIGKSGFEVIPLRGEKFHDSRAFGDIAAVITHSEARRNVAETYHLHIVGSNKTATIMDSRYPIAHLKIPGTEGTVLLADHHIVFLTNPSKSPRTTHFSSLVAPGKVESIEPVTVNGIDLLKVNYRGNE